MPRRTKEQRKEQLKIELRQRERKLQLINQRSAVAKMLQWVLTGVLALGFATLVSVHAPDVFAWVFGYATYLSWWRKYEVRSTFFHMLPDIGPDEEMLDGQERQMEAGDPREEDES